MDELNHRNAAMPPTPAGLASMSSSGVITLGARRVDCPPGPVVPGVGPCAFGQARKKVLTELSRSSSVLYV
jgi:hypothetical protein